MPEASNFARHITNYAPVALRHDLPLVINALRQVPGFALAILHTVELQRKQSRIRKGVVAYTLGLVNKAKEGLFEPCKAVKLELNMIPGPALLAGLG